MGRLALEVVQEDASVGREAADARAPRDRLPGEALRQGPGEAGGAEGSGEAGAAGDFRLGELAVALEL